MTNGSPDRRKRSKWDEPRDPRLDRESHRHDRDRSSGRSRWDDRREDRRSRSPESSRRRSRSPTVHSRSSATPSAETKKAVDPAAAAGSNTLQILSTREKSCLLTNG